MKTLIIIMVLTGALFSEQIFVEPPIDFSNTPVKVAIETLFLKAGAKYLIEVNLSTYGSVTMLFKERQELDELLKLILESKKLDFEKDKAGIYHIKTGKAINEEDDNFGDIIARSKLYITWNIVKDKLQYREYLKGVDPTKKNETVDVPLEFAKIPIIEVLSVILAKTGNNFMTAENSMDFKVTYKLMEKMKLDDLLNNDFKGYRI
ncbi:MAG: hypothetical protein A2452_04785 [Candidatus Firestonebacteria bacterium RIFOXYC2_FULL_39_67]|nr:MAG: hypothetical protein A2536_11320 [Candidatus Firestonebacteria bacterium RIFOXYD2_FULL_39_29]OGF53256.1 MAG: hypothetical protein A2497_02675 [Candidatus Firestonebacteria bacterium RifOxyC12_full_39_7]OGF55794.1 MAG: hypothetical protein A2452_04785 [Candidatus Firestonebacteria bacterium RIFOXYC2_FULL_39_67]